MFSLFSTNSYYTVRKKRESKSILITLESGQLSSTRGFTNCRKAAAAAAASLMMSVAASLRRSATRQRKDLVSADKEVGEILERRSSSLPLPPSLLPSLPSMVFTSHSLAVAAPSLTAANCLPCPVMTRTNTLLSRSAQRGG